MLRRRQRRIEELDQLRHVDSSRIEFDVDAAVDRVGVVAVDAERAHQLAFDRVTQRTFAMQQAVVEPNRTQPLAFRAPSRDATGITPVAHHAVPVARGGGSGDGHGFSRVRRAAAEQQGQLIQHVLPAVPPCVIPQVDGGRPGRRERRVLDRRQSQRDLQKASAQSSVQRGI